MRERISAAPQLHFGKPCVAGTRIPVVDVLELVEDGRSFQQIIEGFYPDLTPEDIRACIRYAIELAENEEIHISAVPLGGRPVLGESELYD